jgi:hypothetical protein
MEPFIILTPYSILVCTACKWACVAREIPTHLRTYHKRLPAPQRLAITQAVLRTPGLYKSQKDLELFQLPQQAVQAIPELEGPYSDGLRCKVSYLLSTV